MCSVCRPINCDRVTSPRACPNIRRHGRRPPPPTKSPNSPTTAHSLPHMRTQMCPCCLVLSRPRHPPLTLTLSLPSSRPPALPFSLSLSVCRAPASLDAQTNVLAYSPIPLPLSLSPSALSLPLSLSLTIRRCARFLLSHRQVHVDVENPPAFSPLNVQIRRVNLLAHVAMTSPGAGLPGVGESPEALTARLLLLQANDSNLVCRVRPKHGSAPRRRFGQLQ